MSHIDIKVRKIISEQLNVPLQKILPDSSFLENLGADSLGKAELIMAIEDEFGITIDESMSQRVQTVLDVIKCVNELVGRIEGRALAVKSQTRGIKQVPA
jgi:acyl carrier protein